MNKTCPWGEGHGRGISFLGFPNSRIGLRRFHNAVHNTITAGGNRKQIRSGLLWGGGGGVKGIPPIFSLSKEASQGTHAGQS